MTSSNASFEAFVNAMAGSIGSLFAMAGLYPLDVLKIRQQASTSKSNTSLMRMAQEVYKTNGASGFMVGIESKSLHTFCSSFCFFYWVAFLKAKITTASSVSASQNLLLNSVAAALNMTITLPLECITTRLQVSSRRDPQHTIVSVFKQLIKDDPKSLWKGYIASLVLVSNPAINFTVFDALKAKRLALTCKRSLSMKDAFVLGAVAKCVATMLTYPIIRAKVVMQASSKDKESSSSLLQVLERIYKNDGLSGYYIGCRAQLLNTVLKSALLLMTKEKITALVMKFFYSLKQKRITNNTTRI